MKKYKWDKKVGQFLYENKKLDKKIVKVQKSFRELSGILNGEK